ncbi:MAG: hypothetical protein GY703_18655 [Gammaproteobacteria bacterium]|nr:hypothetical protein [Gammaproteobacteria bacterium]
MGQIASMRAFVTGTLNRNSGSFNMRAALLGQGITALPIWMVKPYLKNGMLVQVLSDYEAENIPFNAVYPKNRYVPLKVRSFLDFLKQRLEKEVLLEH